MNFLTGFVLILILFSQATGFVLPTIDGFLEGYGVEDSGLQPGDVVYSLDGHRIYNYNNLTFFLGRAGDTLDFVVLRDGEKVRLDGVEMPLQARTDEEGKTTYLRGISVGREIIPATWAASCCTAGTTAWILCARSGSAWEIWSPGWLDCGTCQARWAS